MRVSFYGQPTANYHFFLPIFAAMFALIRRFLFMMPPEKAHHFSMYWIHIFLKIPILSSFVTTKVRHERHLSSEIAGIRFPNRIGMAAGFDKDAKYFDDLGKMGFGFVEIGTVTPFGQHGNPKPRLFRLPADHALINRMGFNNEGAKAAAARLDKREDRRLIIGGNIGKNKNTPNENADNDYLVCFRELHPYVDYFTVNVSSPNTPGLRELQDKDALKKLLNSIQKANNEMPTQHPIFLNIAPDLTNEQLDDVIAIVHETGIQGIVATNTTISREGLQTPKEQVEAMGAGGLSGAPLKARAGEVLRYLRKCCNPEIVLMSSGGIMDVEEALKRIEDGADLVQLYTGFIYEGPGLLKRIKKALLEN